MKKFILFLLLLMPVYTNAQIVGGEYQCVTAGSNVKFLPYTFDEKTFLVMEFTNHNNCFERQHLFPCFLRHQPDFCTYLG